MTIHPQAVTDRHDRLWAWDATMGGYRHDGTETLLSNLETLQAEAGPLTAPNTDGNPDDPDELAERYLELKAKTTPPRNVFEWCWEHPRLASKTDRPVLLRLAFMVDDEGGTADEGAAADVDELSTLCGMSADRVQDSLWRLNLRGQLVFRWISPVGPFFSYEFPGYEKWLTEHEVAW